MNIHMKGMEINFLVLTVMFGKEGHFLSKKVAVEFESGNPSIIFKDGEPYDGEIEDLVKTYLELKGFCKPPDDKEYLLAGKPEKLFVN